MLNSQDIKTLKKSLNVLKQGEKIVLISGSPTPDFAKEMGAPWFVKIILSLINASIRKKAKKKDIDYSFLFMRAEGEQLRQIGELIESGNIKPVLMRYSHLRKRTMHYPM